MRFIQTQETSVTRFRDAQGTLAKVTQLCDSFVEGMSALEEIDTSSRSGKLSRMQRDLAVSVVEVMTDAPKILHVKAKPTT